ncbi:MAG: 8-oxo-dGTP diphosphatase [Candidatus Moraniibacteriota bacterium]
MKRKFLTLTLLVRDGRILLGMKKRGFGAGRWNGFGGKVQENETIEEAAKRETEEECGIVIGGMTEVGIHEFEFEKERGNILEVHVFRIDAFTGEPVETEEMRPEWFPIGQIPYDLMWPDDRYWLPLFLAGKKFRTRFLFGEGDTVLEQDIQVTAE